MQENKETFKYTYSSTEQKEIEKIRKKYIKETQYGQEISLEYLRRLDKNVTKKGAAVGITIGVIFTLVMGGGMSLLMVFGDDYFFPGLLIGIIGLAGVVLAYPIYCKITEKERERIAPEILRITDDLSKNK